MRSINKELTLRDGDIIRISTENSKLKTIIKCIGNTINIDNEFVDEIAIKENLPLKKVIDKNTIEYQANEGLYVYYHTIDALFQKYYGCIPKYIENKIMNLLGELLSVAEYSDKRDIKEEEFFKRVVFEDK